MIEWNWWETDEYPPEGEYTGFQDTVPMGVPFSPIKMTELEGIEYRGARYVLCYGHWCRLTRVTENHWDGKTKREYYAFEAATPRYKGPAEDSDSTYNFKGWERTGREQ